MKTTKEIQLLGIIRNSPKSNSQDGGCGEMINLRYKDGAIRPASHKSNVTPPILSSDMELSRHSALPANMYLVTNILTRSIVLMDINLVATPIIATIEFSDEGGGDYRATVKSPNEQALFYLWSTGEKTDNILINSITEYTVIVYDMRGQRKTITFIFDDEADI